MSLAYAHLFPFLPCSPFLKASFPTLCRIYWPNEVAAAFIGVFPVCIWFFILWLWQFRENVQQQVLPVHVLLVACCQPFTLLLREDRCHLFLVTLLNLFIPFRHFSKIMTLVDSTEAWAGWAPLFHPKSLIFTSASQSNTQFY